MKMLDGTKFFFALIQDIMVQDPDDYLLLEDHETEQNVRRLSCTISKRSLTIKEGLFRVDVGYHNLNFERHVVTSFDSMDDVEDMGKRIMDYLNCVTKAV